MTKKYKLKHPYIPNASIYLSIHLSIYLSMYLSFLPMSTEMKCKILKMVNATQASGKPKIKEKLFMKKKYFLVINNNDIIKI